MTARWKRRKPEPGGSLFDRLETSGQQQTAEGSNTADRPCRLPLAPPPAQWHSQTSVAAAKGVAPARNRLCQAVLDYLRGRGDEGATDEEIQHALNGPLGMGPSTERPRRIELVAAGLVKDSGRTRPTASGRKATVWVAVEVPDNSKKIRATEV